MQRFNLNKLKEAEGKEWYLFEISNRFAALENLDADVDINAAWETERISKLQPKRVYRFLRIEEA
jgi:hypothetical protein